MAAVRSVWRIAFAAFRRWRHGEATDSLDDPRVIAKLAEQWWGLEGAAVKVARMHEPVVTEIADQGFRLIRRGTEVTSQSQRVPMWEIFMALGFAQLYNTSMAAWELAYGGLYIQAHMLARLMTEYLGLVWYLPNHPDEVKEWNQSDAVLPRGGDLLQQAFAEEADLGANFLALREHLHRFSHLDKSGLRVLIGEDQDPLTVPINIGGRFDQPKFQDTARILLPLHASIPAAMEKWKRGADPTWSADVAEFVRRVAKVVDEYDLRTSNEVTTSAATPSSTE